jgi:hypothetical protein
MIEWIYGLDHLTARLGGCEYSINSAHDVALIEEYFAEFGDIIPGSAEWAAAFDAKCRSAA